MPRIHKTFTVFIMVACVAPAQIFYNETRDKKAQEAEATAKQIATGSLFEKELRNVNALAALQIQAQLDLARPEWLTALDGLTTWGDVRNYFQTIEQTLTLSSLSEEDRKARLERIRAKQIELKKLLAGMTKPEHKGTAIENILDRLDEGKSVLEFAEKLANSDNQKVGQAFDRLEATLDVAISLYESWKKAREGIRAIEQGLTDLVIPPELLEAELLRLEESYLNQLGIIAAREELEGGESLQLIAQAKADMGKIRVPDGSASDARAGRMVRDEENIDETLQAAIGDRISLFWQMHVLHTTAAIATRNTLPRRLADLRAAQETWRHAIRQDAASAKSHEQLLLASSQRLAMYYKGGIKPGQVAQLLYNLSGLVSLPIIAAK